MEKTIEFKGDITALKNEYTQFVHQPEIDSRKVSIRLIYSQPTDLHYGRYRSEDKILLEHTVKRLFFYGKEHCCNCEWEPETPAVGVYYVAGNKRSSGFPLPILNLQQIIITPFSTDYSSDWERIMNSLGKYNINLDTAVAIGSHLTGKTEHIEGFQNYWKKTDKPKLMSFKDIVGSRTIQQMMELATPSQYSKDTKVYDQKRRGQRRDRSITLEIRPNGVIRYYAASEYAGCGNGDYYTMFSPTMAFYSETD